MSLNWFANVLVHHPYVILFGVTIFSGTCLVIPFTLKAFPNFSDPHMGYQTRGTSIANRLTTWNNLFEATRESGLFTVNPREYLQRSNITNLLFKPKRKKRNFDAKNKEDTNKVNPKIHYEKPNSNDTSENSWIEIRKIFNISKNDSKIGKKEWSRLGKDGYFCGSPNKDYAHLVLESSTGEDLFTLRSLQIICRIEYKLIQTKHYKELCDHSAMRKKKCCRPWSLPNYIALLQNRTSCLAITEEDVDATKSLLRNCSYYYHNLKLPDDCRENSELCNIPAKCRKHEAVFNILNFVTSTSFLPPNKTNDVILKETMIFIPLACSTAILPYYHELKADQFTYGGITVVAMEFGIKSLLFDEYLIKDTWLLSIGGLFVLLCMWLYTGSLFLTIMTIIAIVFSLGISYFMYTLVFELQFFPFMNLLTAVVAMGIGADDAFIFCKVWHVVKENNSGPLLKIMTCTMQHALVSMIITSFTTAAAFFASYVSAITAIKCFSVFACTAVLVNCLMMILWFPSCVIVWEQVPQLQSSLLRGVISAITVRWCCMSSWASTLSYRPNCINLASYFHMHENIIVEAVIRFRYFWFILLSIVGIISGGIVLYYPGLQLPNSPDLQLLRSSHPFERYDLDYKHKFWFSKSDPNDPKSKLPLRFVWGLVPQDNGNHLEPLSFGTLKLDNSFNMSHPESQVWLLKFCKDLRKQSFYEPEMGFLLSNCFIESFIEWMKRRCADPVDKTIDYSPCCETEKFPFRSWVFDTCIIEAIGDLYATPPHIFIPGAAGPKFSKDQTPTIKAVVVEYFSNYTYTLSFEYMDRFVQKVESWFDGQMRTAPSTMKGGWFVSELEFYDLQKTLSQSTLIAILMSMGLAFLVLLLATLNILMSVFAIINITCSILVTMAVLVLLGWKLNILESIAVSTAIGLAVDFSLHYTVNYKLISSEFESRITVTRCALTNMLKPVSMAALTTGMVGAFMIPSTVLAYIQIGTFLLLVMCVSWLYSTFHLGAMLAIVGPQHNFGQCTYTQLFCYTFKHRKSNLVRNQPATSSISDTHELDLLTSKSCSNTSAPNILQHSLSSGGKHNCGRFVLSDQSPSAASAITVIMPDDT